MSKVTGKLQVTLPKRLAETYGIRVGDEVEIVAAGESIAIVPARAARAALSPEKRLRHFDEATQRIDARKRREVRSPAEGRGWSRDELYTRGWPR